MATGGPGSGAGCELSEGDLSTLTKLLETAAPRWMAVGDALGFLDSELKAISTIPRLVTAVAGDPGYFRELLSRWLKWAPPNHPLPTIGPLVSALRAAGEERLAFDLPHKFHQRKELPPKDQKLLPPTKRARVTGPAEGRALLQPSDCLLSSSERSLDDAEGESQQQIDAVMQKIEEFEKKFHFMKLTALTEMINARVSVAELAMTITSLPATVMDEHRVFLRENAREMCRADDITAVFVWLNTYWDYLNYALLQHIVDQYGDPETQRRMKVYVNDLKQFRKSTPLHLFCKAQPRRHLEVPPGFRVLVTKHEKSWSDCTLEDVEQFRQRFACQYGLREVALMLREMELGSIVITWWIPASVASHLGERLEWGLVLPRLVLRSGRIRSSRSRGIEFLSEQGILEITIKAQPESDEPESDEPKWFEHDMHVSIKERLEQEKRCGLYPFMKQEQEPVQTTSKRIVEKQKPTLKVGPELLEQSTSLYSRTQTEPVKSTKTLRSLMSAMEVSHVTGGSELPTKAPRTHKQPPTETLESLLGPGHKFTPTTQPQMLEPVRVIGDLHYPWRIAITSSREIVVTEPDRLSFLTMDGQRIRAIEYIETDSGRHGLLRPSGVTVDEDGAIYVTDNNTHKLHKFSPDGKIIKSVGGYGKEAGKLRSPEGIGIRNQKLFVSDFRRIQIFNTDLQFISSFGSESWGDLAFDSSGNIYVAGGSNNSILVYSEDGTLLRTFGTARSQLTSPQGIHIDHNHVYVTHTNGCISLFYTSGEFITSFRPQEVTAVLHGITTDRDGLVYVCDTRNNCIQVFPRVL